MLNIFEFDLNPLKIDSGDSLLHVHLKNVGNDTVNNLELKLHSLDTYCIAVEGMGEFIPTLMSDEWAIRTFRVSAESSTDVYVSVTGLLENGDRFASESQRFTVKVGQVDADLVSMFALTEPYTPMGKVVKVEANIRCNKDVKDLDLVFRAEKDLGRPKEIQRIAIKQLSTGQEARYTTEITPTESGYYTIDAYLYHRWRKIGHKSTNIWVV